MSLYNPTIRDISAVNRQRCERWHEGMEPWIGSDWSNALAGEVGEACNVVKKLRRLETGARGRQSELERDGLLDALALEMADSYLYWDLLGHHFDIDLPLAIQTKFNRTSREFGFPEQL